MPSYLLDTDAFLWWLWRDPRLGPVAHSIIDSRENEVYVSAVSFYEISYKANRRRLERETPVDLETAAAADGFERLELSPSHAERAGWLPLRHRDPFDRMLAAQAIANGLTLVTSDAQMAGFGIPVLAARH